MTTIEREVNYRINPKMDDGSVIIRKARKYHRCQGGHNGECNVACHEPIKPGSPYVEYVGESAPFHSGHRYHPACAAEQGLLEKL